MSSGPIVYVVDDDLGVRKALSFLLVSAGLNVRLYESATAFLKEVKDPGRCCIVTDVRMPGTKDGFQLARGVAAARSHVRIFIMSGHTGTADTTPPPGAVFISKPFDHEKLIGRLKAALANDD